MPDTSNPLGSPVIKDLTPKPQQESPGVQPPKDAASQADAAKPNTA